ncbi:hypothetical protein [Lacticaseibacillus daqingensis]|uniref:hypothetical protein n=1 Tax=Lacticaseibacillus daqingensis TaxID=2486014 RepID=UPI000F76D7AC|nr:hypothetical protein [Lacticaseibacillus daqingensis]
MKRVIFTVEDGMTAFISFVAGNLLLWDETGQAVSLRGSLFAVIAATCIILIRLVKAPSHHD